MWTVLEIKDGKYTNAPEIGKSVIAILEDTRAGKNSKKFPIIIKYADDTNSCWYYVDDNEPVSLSFKVIKWIYTPHHINIWNNVTIENGKYINAPELGRPVIAVLQWGSGKQVLAVIKHVNGDDHSWETVDDNSEISTSLDVIKWIYIPEY